MGIQLGGNIKFGAPLVDYSDFVSQLVINRSREQINRRPTFGKPRGSTRAGAITETVTIMFESDFDSASLWAEFWEAQETDSAEIPFSASFEDGPEGITANPTYSGTLVVTSLDTGGTPGQAREQTLTLPVTDAGITKTPA